MNKEQLVAIARKQVKRFADLGMLTHSNTLVANLLRKHKCKDPEVEQILKEMADYIDAHPEMCYPEFQAEFRKTYGRRPEVMAELIEIAKPHKKLLREFAKVRRDDYKELDWGADDN